jgi:endoglucanase
VRFTTLGGVVPQMLMGGRVRFVNGTPGVLHTEPLERNTEAPAVEKMFIDVGATSNKNHPVKVGDVAGFERPFLDLGGRLVAKSMDDRIGCAVAIETLRALKRTPNDVYFVFTTQEEVGTRGRHRCLRPGPGHRHFDRRHGLGRHPRPQGFRDVPG